MRREASATVVSLSAGMVGGWEGGRICEGVGDIVIFKGHDFMVDRLGTKIKLQVFKSRLLIVSSATIYNITTKPRYAETHNNYNTVCGVVGERLVGVV